MPPQLRRVGFNEYSVRIDLTR